MRISSSPCGSSLVWTTSRIAKPAAQPIECQRSSSSTTRSRYETTFGSSKTRAAVSNETPCFRRLERFLFSSHAKTICIYKSVAHYPAGLGFRLRPACPRSGRSNPLLYRPARLRSVNGLLFQGGLWRTCRLLLLDMRKSLPEHAGRKMQLVPTGG